MFKVTEQFLNSIEKIHFIGIGGSGMYPLAQILHGQGFSLSGSDNNETETLKAVRGMGISVFLGHSAQNITGSQLVVYSAAIMQDNPEIVAAKELNIPTIERSEMLGLITERFQNAINVSGTHGKTTVSSMITTIMLADNLDISAVIGGKLPQLNGSGRLGSSETIVCEACEFVDTFLKMHTDVAVILNIDEDHLDYFKNLDNIIKSFNLFASKATKAVIYNGDDENSVRATENILVSKVTFGFGEENDYYPKNIVDRGGALYSFDLYKKGEKLLEVMLNVPGMHNVINAVSAAATADYCGVSTEGIMRGLEDFRGAGRRFEFIGKLNGALIYDDYAHHPKELEVTLTAAMRMGFDRVVAVFQPFTFSRTKLLFDDFIEVLKIPDMVILTEIMGSREVNSYNIYSDDIAEKLDNAENLKTFEATEDYLRSIAKQGDLIITLGCGDIYKVAKAIAY